MQVDRPRLRHTGETLLGRMAVIEVGGFTLDEVGEPGIGDLWRRGGSCRIRPLAPFGRGASRRGSRISTTVAGEGVDLLDGAAGPRRAALRYRLEPLAPATRVVPFPFASQHRLS